MAGSVQLPADLVVADLMTIDAIVIRDDAWIDEAKRMMERYEVTGLPVVDEGGQLVGVISQTDLVRALGTPIRARRDPVDLTVEDLMSSPAITVEMSTSLRDAARLMRDEQIHRVVAIDDAGRAVGVLSSMDFVELYAE